MKSFTIFKYIGKKDANTIIPPVFVVSPIPATRESAAESLENGGTLLEKLPQYTHSKPIAARNSAGTFQHKGKQNAIANPFT